MRLLKLKIRNLASLKGEHLINFKEIQSHSPLFAITGETGAGKSTILNSIALVLYGKVYKTSVNQTDLVTLGERDGEAQLIFQLGGKNYLAEWRGKIRNQRTGEYLKKPETSRYIYPINGDDFNSTRESPIESTENLLRLDFDQFCKCIILNQGEFARFLSSSFTERKEILEKLYPGEMLESLSRELKGELDTLKKENNDLDIELETLKGDGEDGTQLKGKKEVIENDLKLTESWLSRIESLEFHFISLMDYHKKYFENKKKSENIKSELMKETSTYNTVLKETMDLADAFHLVQKDQEENLPLLQEYLKSEEILKQWSDNYNQISLKLADIKKTETNIKEKITQIQKSLTESESIKEKTSKGIKHPVTLLKRHRNDLDHLFETFQEHESLVKSKQDKTKGLDDLEQLGKTHNLELKKIQETLLTYPANIDKLLLDLEERKKENQIKVEAKQTQLQKITNLEDQLSEFQKEILKTQSEYEKASSLIAEKQGLILPLEATLKLQSLLNAVEICVTHPEAFQNEECPVCHSKVSQSGWDDLKKSLSKANFSELRKTHEDLQRLVFSSEEEIKILTQRKKNLNENVLRISSDVATLKELVKVELPSQKSLDDEFQKLQKKSWDLESLRKDEARINQELVKTRTQFLALRDELSLRQQKIDSQQLLLTELKLKLIELLPELNTSHISDLKNDLRLLSLYLEQESKVEKIALEKSHLLSTLGNLEQEYQKTLNDKNALEIKIAELKVKLELRLKGQKASDLIQNLDRKVKDLREKWTLKEKENKKIELNLKGFQSSITTLDEHLKEIDLLYSKELHQIRELGGSPLPEIKSEVTPLMEKLAKFSLEIIGSFDLFIPFKEKLSEEKAYFKNHSNSLRMDFASLGTKLSEWERKQDRMTLLSLKRTSIHTRLERLDRLYDILGKDELRTFVLSLVEENLIRQTNEELQKLCMGRYEIIHQRKLEFWILDKYREGGLRKVSTLSGGETFMVSLAMALALAEMTRGQAEIDTLFIDEGFGTLDQESLEDVLDMLQQIQTRGLMVGIISHIKALTQSLQINLLVSKKSDGTSDVSLKFN